MSCRCSHSLNLPSGVIVLSAQYDFDISWSCSLITIVKCVFFRIWDKSQNLKFIKLFHAQLN